MWPCSPAIWHIAYSTSLHSQSAKAIQSIATKSRAAPKPLRSPYASTKNFGSYPNIMRYYRFATHVHPTLMYTCHRNDYPITCIILNSHCPSATKPTLGAKAKHPTMPVLAIGIYNNEMSMMKMHHCSANGFITKSASWETLFEAIEEVRTDNFYFNIGDQYLVHKKCLYQNDRKVTCNRAVLTNTEKSAEINGNRKSIQRNCQ